MKCSFINFITLLFLSIFLSKTVLAKNITAEKAVLCKKESECPYFMDVYKGNKNLRNALLKELKNSGIKKPLWFPSSFVNGPITPTTINNKTYILGSACKPHACPDDFMNILYLPKNKHLVGVYVSENKLMWFGVTSAEEKKFLNNIVLTIFQQKKIIESKKPPVTINKDDQTHTWIQKWLTYECVTLPCY